MRAAARAQMTIEAFFDEATFTASYVVSDDRTKRCAIIDPVLDFDPHAGRVSTHSVESIARYVREHGYQVEFILETHAHADHLSGAAELKARLGGVIAIGAHITDVQQIFARIFNFGAEFVADGRQFDRLLREGDVLSCGDLEISVLHTPGHTPACLTYLIGDAAFIGDTLFMPDYGTARADFPGGDARVLYRSIQRILSLPESTRLFLCHDYKAQGREHFVWESSVAAQKSGNVHIHDGVSEEDFVAMRTARDKTLGMPRLILPSIQVNIRAGHLPLPDANGISYLRLPINVL